MRRDTNANWPYLVGQDWLDLALAFAGLSGLVGLLYLLSWLIFALTGAGS